MEKIGQMIWDLLQSVPVVLCFQIWAGAAAATAAEERKAVSSSVSRLQIFSKEKGASWMLLS